MDWVWSVLSISDILKIVILKVNFSGILCLDNYAMPFHGVNLSFPFHTTGAYKSEMTSLTPERGSRSVASRHCKAAK
jgi:hypothetical protein